ncbi:MAG TPA: LysR family transcriptional regulator [Phycisphaerae bacterium]|jgi:molybdate transport system regulatory protein
MSKARKSSASASRADPPAPQLRARIWVDVGTRAALTEAGADLLEQIAACGSLSAAARKLQFSYRRAWMLLDAMNTHWGCPVARTATGGMHGGGATLTEFGHALLAAYRHVQVQMEFSLDQEKASFAKSITQAKP